MTLDPDLLPDRCMIIRGAINDEWIYKYYGKTQKQVICAYYTPSNPQTAFQQSNRGKFAAAILSWQSLSASERDAWHSQASRLPMSGYNLFIRTQMLIDEEVNLMNLKLSVNADVNKLDIFEKITGALPTSLKPINIEIPDGTGNTLRSRSAAYLSGTSQFVLADATNYWSKGSSSTEIKTAAVYAIWDGTGIIWALGGYSGFTRVPASTTVTDDDFFLLEDGSTYTKVITDFCVCVGFVRYIYNTAAAPDHTIQASVLDAPQVVYAPQSNYARVARLAANVTSSSNIDDQSLVSIVVKQSGMYNLHMHANFLSTGGKVAGIVRIKNGATYSSAALLAFGGAYAEANVAGGTASVDNITYLNAGDTIHGGGQCGATASGTRKIFGDAEWFGITLLSLHRVD